MWRTIKKGKHNNFSIPGIHFGKTSETYEVMFDESCRYDLHGFNQDDWNKLVGWSYGLHHNNSIRVGWRYNVALDVIELCNYAYLNGIRVIEQYESIPINKKHIITIDTIDSDFKPTWGYNLDLYFGGDEVAPHDIRVWLRKV